MVDGLDGRKKDFSNYKHIISLGIHIFMNTGDNTEQMRHNLRSPGSENEKQSSWPEIVSEYS